MQYERRSHSHERNFDSRIEEEVEDTKSGAEEERKEGSGTGSTGDKVEVEGRIVVEEERTRREREVGRRTKVMHDDRGNIVDTG